MNITQLSVIIEKCKGGDKQAFKHIVLDFSDYIFALAFRILCNEEDARDIVQETFIRVWENMDRYKPEIKITTWMYKITINLCLDKLRIRKRKPSVYNLEHKELLDSFFDEDLVDKLDNEQIASIIQQLAENLSPKQKLVFVLKDIEGMETDEIEKVTGMDKVQIKSNLYYARQQIKNSLIQTGYEVR